MPSEVKTVLGEILKCNKDWGGISKDKPHPNWNSYESNESPDDHKASWKKREMNANFRFIRIVEYKRLKVDKTFLWRSLCEWWLPMMHSYK